MPVLDQVRFDRSGHLMRVSFRFLALLSVLSLVAMPAETSAQQRRRQGVAQQRAPQLKVPPIQVIGNFSNPDDAQSAIFSPDGKLVALAGYSGLTLWDTASGRPVRSLTQRPYFTANAFSEDGRMMVTGHKDGIVRIWDIETGSVSNAAAAIPARGKSKTGTVGRPRTDPHAVGRSARRILRHRRQRRGRHDLEPCGKADGFDGAAAGRQHPAHP